MRDSAFKRSLAELPVGADVDVEPPKGSFALPEDASRPLVFVAGGIGITVFRSMLLHIREQGLPHRVTLIYSNRDRESTAFLDELRELENDNPNLRLVLTMTAGPGLGGREPEDRLSSSSRDHLGEELDESTFLVAGPPGMVEGMQKALAEAGVADENVIAERYSGY